MLDSTTALHICTDMNHFMSALSHPLRCTHYVKRASGQDLLGSPPNAAPRVTCVHTQA